MPKKAGEEVGQEARLEVCDTCQLYTTIPDGHSEATCSCGATVARTSAASNTDGWIQCDACQKWRSVSPAALAAYEAAGGEWSCPQQFPGASCARPSDWLGGGAKSRKRQRAEREAAAQALAARQAEEALRTKREWRAAQRSAGVSAAERYSEAAGEAIDLLHLIGIDPAEMRQEGADDGAYKPGGGWHAGGGGGGRRCRGAGAEEAPGLAEGRDVWESCEQCGQWVNLGAAPAEQAEQAVVEAPQVASTPALHEGRPGQGGHGAPSAPCPDCGAAVRWRGHAETQSWVQCDDCGRWRSVEQEVLAAVEAGGAEARWVCSGMRPGVTCRTSANDWGRVVRAQATKAARQGLGRRRPELSMRHAGRQLLEEQGGAAGQAAAPAAAHWQLHALPPSNFVEFIHGRDTLLSAQQLAAGLDAYDAGSGEHILAVTLLPQATLALAAPLVLRGLELFAAGALPELTDGRASAGPVDLAAFLAQPAVGEAVKQALHRRRARRSAAGLAAQRDPAALPCVVHVSAPDQRKVYVGDEHDTTKQGGSIMGFMKSWKSRPIQSWSGGVKYADMPGATPNKLVKSKLSSLLAAEEPALVAAAEAVFALLAARPATAATALRMLSHLAADPVRAASRLGSSGFNAYSFNIDYQTGKHLDAKNVPGSYSALLVFETGAPFCGCHYLLPQYRVALELRQGLLLFHRSGDAEIGLHANSGLWCPDTDSHRCAVVLYQTELKGGSAPKQEATPAEGEEGSGGALQPLAAAPSGSEGAAA